MVPVVGVRFVSVRDVAWTVGRNGSGSGSGSGAGVEVAVMSPRSRLMSAGTRTCGDRVRDAVAASVRVVPRAAATAVGACWGVAAAAVVATMVMARPDEATARAVLRARGVVTGVVNDRWRRAGVARCRARCFVVTWWPPRGDSPSVSRLHGWCSVVRHPVGGFTGFGVWTVVPLLCSTVPETTPNITIR